MFKQNIKTITQDAGTFYDTIFNHPKTTLTKKSNHLFDNLKNNREYGNLEKCIVLAQGAPDKVSSGIFLFDKKLNDVKEELNNAKPTFTSLLEELETLKQDNDEEALRGVCDPSASVTSNITSGSSSKHND
ncbi:biogenesis of lysosome-related organelles complex 1 subunit 5-like [Gigaspora margarita]|uniref:Biogenesis of lysosome-related organelles complex 1 subunit 5-like n=1 Tax=Gigaspora margarita TaxID=4874 RepID=A0A8H4EIR5_GIGMA|nr:biogenesis of lysosome-related organelles complex 1 subunit 5-like [Gigaspora margarita]